MSAYPSSSGTTSGYEGVQLFRCDPFSGDLDVESANRCGLVAGDGYRFDPFDCEFLGGVRGIAAEYLARVGSLSFSGGGVMGRSDSVGWDLKIVDGDVNFFLKDSILLGVAGLSPSSCLLPKIPLNLLDFGDSSLLWSILPTSIDSRLPRFPSVSGFGLPFPFSDPLRIREMIEGIVQLLMSARKTQLDPGR